MSLSVIGAVAAVVIGGTSAFFSDTETSTGNTFTAGAIDLKINNKSYVSNQTTGELIASPNTSWVDADTEIKHYFDFTDVKPGDRGEDTISLTVDNNDAWACAELTLTSNKDNTCTEPELGVDTSCTPSSTNLFDGELAQGIEFVWWADDGDNVLEVGEEATKYYLGPDSISNLLGSDNKLDLTVADSVLNFFDPTTAGPLTGGATYNLGKGWCFGDMTLTPVNDATGDTTSGPLVRGTGFTCDGATVNNASQTDSLTADITFTAVQSRNNMNFLCPEHQTPTTPQPVHVTSAPLQYGPNGWAGWSCPANTTVVPGTLLVSGGDLASTYAWKTGATTGSVTYPNTPFGYTYGASETGFIGQNDNDGESIVLSFDCQAN